MRTTYNIIRAVLATFIALPPTLAVMLYVLLSLPWVQDYLCGVAQRELSGLLGVDVNIGKVYIAPFDKVWIKDVSIADDNGKKAFSIGLISAGIDVRRLVLDRRIVVDYVEVDRLDAHFYRSDINGPTNIQGIISRLRPKDSKKTPSRFDFKVNTVVIGDASVAYDVKNEPDAKDGVFDINHIKIEQFNAIINLPRISNDDIHIQLVSLRAIECSGLEIKDMYADFKVSSNTVSLSRFGLEMPGSYIEFGYLGFVKDALLHLPLIDVTEPVQLIIKDGSYITPSDLSPLLPALSSASMPIALSLDATVDRDKVEFKSINISQAQEGLLFGMHGTVFNYVNKDSLYVDVPSINLHAEGNGIARYIRSNFPTGRKISKWIAQCGDVSFDGNLSGSIGDALLCGKLSSGTVGAVDINLHSSRSSIKSPTRLKGQVSTPGINVSKISTSIPMGYVAGEIDLNLILSTWGVNGNLEVDLESLMYKDYIYHDISLVVGKDKDIINIMAYIDDPNLFFKAEGFANLDPKVTEFHLDGDICRFRPDMLGLWYNYPGYELSAKVNAAFLGRNIENADGVVEIGDILYTNGDDSLKINKLHLGAYSTDSPKYIELKSDFINGEIRGRDESGHIPYSKEEKHEKYRFSELLPTIKDILSSVFPKYIASDYSCGAQEYLNNFSLDLKIDPCEQICSFFKLPVSIIDTVSINAVVDDVSKNIFLDVNAPYLMAGNNLVDSTEIKIDVDGWKGYASMWLQSRIGTKKGPMTVSLNSSAFNDKVDTHINWNIDRKKPIGGVFDFDTWISSNSDGKFVANTHIIDSEIVFDDTLWNISNSVVGYEPGRVVIDGFRLKANRDDAILDINGVVSADNTDTLTVRLNSVELVDIFETLDINKALICGKATGRLNASALLSGAPIMETDSLVVENIGYNYTILGDAVVNARWDKGRQSIRIDADIDQSNGELSRIYGDILVTRDSLDLVFDTNKVNIGFLKPFMATFASDINGMASGKARLFGSFKNVDLEGRLYVDSLNMKIGYTDVAYIVKGDSLHIRPGYIEMKDIDVFDSEGHKAKLSGWLQHKCFRDPKFNFDVKDASGLLMYDIASNDSTNWFGRIYGSGKANIKGEPGLVDISVKVSTEGNSVFTFELDNRQIADEYTFITFTDRTEDMGDIILDNRPQAVKDYEAAKNKVEEHSSSDYSITLDVGITPQANITLLMDPATGDYIKATGKGNMILEYGSVNDEVLLNGTYIVDKGLYHFTFQDIILKDFSINNSSRITFNGDPEVADLDIEAAYTIQANLTDLDESFSQDKDLNRTTVPVEAILKVAGNINSPAIGYDIRFPSLSEDIRRKVLSIINTPEMMNQQILYLLTVNRFYTPEYMSATKGNELFSVASSTISSQIGNMLGQLSDNLSIAPSVRSDRGDFSDVEVDLMWSSTLLDNRLLFNGNFGYRDKTLNTNQFIGDFDIEYLLNKRGSWRLKAYNRYNDQNYYLRSAATTQGLGIVYKMDFDNMFKFLFPKKRSKASVVESVPSDSLEND